MGWQDAPTINVMPVPKWRAAPAVEAPAADAVPPLAADASGKGDMLPMAAGVARPPNAPPEYNGLESAIVGAGDATGALDEFGAGVSSFLSGKPYDSELARIRGRISEAQASHPNYFMGGQIAGSIPLAVAIPGGAAARGATLAAKVRSGLYAGAGMGGVFGFNSGEGGLTQRLENAVPSAAIGAGTGALAPAAAAAVGRATAPVLNFFARRPGVPGGAAGRVFKAFERDAVDPAAVRNLGQDAMLVDNNPNLTQQAAKIAASPGSGQQIVRDALTNRAAGANSRIRGDIDATLGPAPVPSAVDAGIVANQRSLGPEYGAAFQGARRVDTTPIADELDSQIVNLRGPAQRALQQVRGMLNVTGQNILDPNPGTLFQTRQAIDGMVAGETNPQVIRSLAEVRQRVDDELGRAVPGIKTADAKYAELARQRDALARGQQVLESGRTAPRPEELANEVAKGAVAPGYLPGPSAVPMRLGQGARAEIERIIGTNTNDVVALNRLIKGEGSWNRDRLATLFGPDKADQVLNVLDREQAFANSTNRITRNSETASRLLADEEVNGGGPHHAFREAKNAWTFGGVLGIPRAGAAYALDKALNFFQGAHLDPRQAEMARMLTAQGPDRDAVLDALVNARTASARNIGQRAKIGSLVEHLITAPSRIGAPVLLGPSSR